MKKLITAVLACVIALASVLIISACSTTGEEKKVMNISCNPQVEFVLDDENKVISVNAINEEGNLIIQANAFVGKSAEDAAELFVSVSKDLGFIVEANATVGDNQIEIAFSGDAQQAKDLYESVKQQVETYLTEENITAAISKAEAITKENLKDLVAKVAPYIEQAKLDAMSQAELIEELYNSRKETADFYSQEVKNAYYQAKANAMELAKMETLKSKVGIVEKAAIEVAMGIYNTAVETLENTRYDLLVKEDAPYQEALTRFAEAKTEYVKFRKQVSEMASEEITNVVTTQLAALDTAVDNAEQALINAGETANATIDNLKATAKTALDAVLDKIEDASIKVSDHLDEISIKQQEKQAEFFTAFETEYANAISAAEAKWAQMKNDLTATPVA